MSEDRSEPFLANKYMNLQVEHIVVQLALSIDLLEACKDALESESPWSGLGCEVKEQARGRIMASLSLASSNIDALLRAEHMP